MSEPGLPTPSEARGRGNPSPVLQAAGLEEFYPTTQSWVKLAQQLLGLFCSIFPLVPPYSEEQALGAWENEGGPPGS